MTAGEDPPLIVIVDDEPIIRDLLREVLTRAGFQVVGFEGAEKALLSLQEALPSLLLTDLSMPGRSGLDLIRSVRSLPGGMALPVVLMSAHFCYGVPTGFRENSGADLLLAKPFKSILNVPTILSGLLPSPVVESEDVVEDVVEETASQTPDPESLAVLAMAWRSRSTGIVRHQERRVARLQRGDPLTAEEHTALVNTLYEGELTFGLEPVNTGEVMSLGPALFDAALRLSKASTVAELLDHVLVERQGFERVTELTLGAAVRRLLHAPGKENANLAERLSNVNVSIEDCAQELAALLLLGLFGLRGPIVTPPPERPDSLPTALQVYLPTEDSERTIALRRLRQELSHLDEVDDYTALGVVRGDDRGLIERGYEHQRARYERVATDTTLGVTIHTMAREVLARLDQAHQRLMDISHQEHESDQEALLFSRGCVALEAKRFDLAARCFRGARVFDRSSPRTLGHLGWAILNDMQRPEAARWQEGLTMLKVSLSMAPTDVTCQDFLAEAKQIIGAAALVELQKVLGEPADRD